MRRVARGGARLLSAARIDWWAVFGGRAVAGAGRWRAIQGASARAPFLSHCVLDVSTVLRLELLMLVLICYIVTYV